MPDQHFGLVRPDLLDAAEAALGEGRLSWRVTDQHGRPANGGSADPIPIGRWSRAVEKPQICRQGWHTTADPLRWRGCRVWLVEGAGLVESDGDKLCWRRIRPLGEVDPQTSGQFDPQIWLRCSPILRGADLSGADLSGANLRNTDLFGANLRDADLFGANLRGADLRCAYLCNTDLCGADLRGANLHDADLCGANLRNTNLFGADLRGAYGRSDWADLVARGAVR